MPDLTSSGSIVDPFREEDATNDKGNTLQVGKEGVANSVTDESSEYDENA